MNALSDFKTKLQSNNVTNDDFVDAYNTVVATMQRRRITTICNNEAFFADLYNHHGLLMMLERGVPMHLWSTREHALLYCYAFRGAPRVFGNVGAPFDAATPPSPSMTVGRSAAALVQDHDADAIATTISVATELARTDNVFERAFDKMVVAVTSFVADEQQEQQRRAVDEWQQHDWRDFNDSLDEYEQSFDCAEFFYSIYVNAPGKKRERNNTFDRKYERLWKKIQTQEGAECVSDVAWQLCNEPPLLALIRNRGRGHGNGGGGLFATMARCCERMQLLGSLRVAMERRARQLLRRTTVTYVLQRDDSSNIDLCVAPVQHVFTIGCAVLDWCRLVDASVGRLGEGAARLRCCFAQTQLPLVDRDASMFFGFDRIPPTAVQWHASCNSIKTDGFALYGCGPLAINVSTVADKVESTTESAVATVQLLFGERLSFDNILRCLYYDNCAGRSLNTLLEPLLLLSVSKCASKANELMRARRAADRFGHIDAFHWPTITTATLCLTPCSPSASSSFLSSSSTTSSSSSSSSSSSCSSSESTSVEVC